MITFPKSDLKYIEVKELFFETKPAIVWMKDKYISPAIKLFLDTLMSLFGTPYKL